MNSLVVLEQVTFGYPRQNRVLSDFSFRLEEGEKVVLAGPIGSGKSTLLHMIVGLLVPQSGRVEVFGKTRRSEQDFYEVRKEVGLLFQDPEDQLFCPTVEEEIAFGPLNLGFRRPEVKARVAEMLERVGLEGYSHRITHHLSGGEKRLVALASVLAMEPNVLLLDEPENDLDENARGRLQQMLAESSRSMIIVSHDESFTGPITTRTVSLNRTA